MTATRLDRSAYEIVFQDRFDSPVLDDTKWIPYYLPHWSTAERAPARYDLAPGILRLRIDSDQPTWTDEDELRVSNLQTACFSGPVGSTRGTHRHRSDLRVRSAWPVRRLFTPSEGLVEITMRASRAPTCMLAFWLVGTEEAAPTESGEICVAEVFGKDVGEEASRINVGLKAHHDPRLHDDMATVELPIDTGEWHTYSATWTAQETRFFVDDDLVRAVPQGTDYPLQLMVDLFELPGLEGATPDGPLMIGEVSAVLGYRSRDATT